MSQSGLFFSQDLKLQQELQLAPQQILSLQILTLPLLELQGKINEELETNPTLERLDSKNEKLIGNFSEGSLAEKSTMGDAAASAAEKDDYLATLVKHGEDWQNYLAPGHAFNSASAETDERRQFFFDSLTSDKTMEEDLSEQLRMNSFSKQIYDFAELIIGSLDHFGYLRTPLELLLEEPKTEANLSILEVALDHVQSFDPPGIAARNLRECLLLQLARSKQTETLAYLIVDNHLDAVSKNQIPQIAKKLSISTSEIYEAISVIKKLQPHPGNIYSSPKTHYIIPEAEIIKKNGKYTVIPNKSQTPFLRISPKYQYILEDPNVPVDVKKYLREKISKSNFLMSSLDQRQTTIIRIVEQIVQEQSAYFDSGDRELKPMTMAQIAEKIGVHETTVSRAISNKHIKCPQGTVQLKKFFSGGYQSVTGENISNKTVKYQIQEMIQDENPKKPLSDQKLVVLLTKNGLDVARRTVAKYREELNIPSSRLRKIHTT